MKSAAPQELMPTGRASNAEVVQRPADRPQGTLIVGGQGSGKTSFLLRSFLNDVRDPNAAVILIDPKSEVARRALALVPPDCGKTVWFLDLAYPRFGMSPLTLPAETMRNPHRLAAAVAGVADNVVNSLLDVNEGQIFQASRDLLYHATIGALAIASAADARPRWEDIYGLLLPYRTDLRDAVVAATAHIPDLDQTHEYWGREIPDMIDGASSVIRQQMKAPRNKVGGIVSVPPLRRFFNHPVDMPMSRIIENRDILIVDAAMGGTAERPGIGEENSIACMHFLLRMLHTNMQHQIHVDAPARARVALHIEECHYVTNELTVDMLATHRAAGLDVTLAHQFFAQLLSAESGARSEKIRKGILNLCQSRCLFRLGDSDDAEAASRIAMPVYESLFRGDADSRARTRATPETLLNLRTWFFLASWIIEGQRAPAFVARTYPIPTGSIGWTRHHYQRLVDRCGAYPTEMGSTYRRSSTAHRRSDSTDEWSGPADAEGTPPRRPSALADGNVDARTERTLEPPGTESTPALVPELPGTSARSRSSRSGDALQPELWDSDNADEACAAMESPVLGLVGKTANPDATATADGPTPESYAELAIIDQISELLPPALPRTTVVLSRVFEQQLRVLKLLDRFGAMTGAQLRRAAWPDGVGERGVQKALARLEHAGLLQRIPTRLRSQSRRSSPPLWALTAKGFRLGQAPPDGLPPVIAARRRFRASEAREGARVRHDLHVVNWMQALHKTIPTWCTDNWRTSRYHSARFTPPRIGEGRRRRPMRPSDVPLGAGTGFSNVPQTLEEIVADLAVELHVVSDPSPRPGRRYALRFDLLLELDLTERPQYNRDKLARYDAFLTGWSLGHPRYRRLGTRPIALFASPSPRATLALMQEADETMKGSVGRLGRPEHEWYFAGRAHTFFVTEGDLHHGSLRALQLPPLPRRLREQLGDESFNATVVNLLPDRLVEAARRPR